MGAMSVKLKRKKGKRVGQKDGTNGSGNKKVTSLTGQRKLWMKNNM